MPPVSFTVSQVCVAATCPRILYFDATHARRNQLARPAVTRIWRPGEDAPAAGTLFHAAVDRFHREYRRLFATSEVSAALTPAAEHDELARALLSAFYWECVDRDALAARDGPQQPGVPDRRSQLHRRVSRRTGVRAPPGSAGR